jgi:hypothetical protein
MRIASSESVRMCSERQNKFVGGHAGVGLSVDY